MKKTRTEKICPSVSKIVVGQRSSKNYGNSEWNCEDEQHLLHEIPRSISGDIYISGCRERKHAAASVLLPHLHEGQTFQRRMRSIKFCQVMQRYECDIRSTCARCADRVQIGTNNLAPANFPLNFTSAHITLNSDLRSEWALQLGQYSVRTGK